MQILYLMPTYPSSDIASDFQIKWYIKISTLIKAKLIVFMYQFTKTLINLYFPNLKSQQANVT